MFPDKKMESIFVLDFMLTLDQILKYRYFNVQKFEHFEYCILVVLAEWWGCR